MKIIYVHHAERDRNKNIVDSKLMQEDDITERGIKEATLFSETLKKIKIKAIITSPYKRCLHTAQIINQNINAPIYFDDRFNEINMEWKEALKLNMQAIDDIVKKYEEDDTIICVTSGVNISAFICYFYKIEPNNNIPYTQVCGISPVIFNYKK